MGAGQGPSAEARVVAQHVRRHRLHLGRTLHVAQLAPVEVALLGPGHPAEEDVARGLGEALAADDPAPVVAVRAGVQVRLEDGGAGLLDLEDQRVAVVAAFEQQDEAAGADAADAHDLACGVEVAVAVEEDPALLGERAAVVAEDLAEGDPVEVGGPFEERRVVDDVPGTARVGLGELAEGLEAGAAAGAGEPVQEAGAVVAVDQLDEVVGGDPLVPDGELPEGREASDGGAVRLGGDEGRPVGLGLAAAVLEGGDGDAGGESLHVPFEGAGVRLVEVVHIEEERPFG